MAYSEQREGTSKPKMGYGGKREGAGRPLGAVGKISAEAILKAKTTGELPHEFLLRVSQSDTVDGHDISLEQRVYAAIAAAPYFAPRLAAIEQRVENTIVSIISSKPLTELEWEQAFGDSTGTSEPTSFLGAPAGPPTRTR